MTTPYDHKHVLDQVLGLSPPEPEPTSPDEYEDIELIDCRFAMKSYACCKNGVENSWGIEDYRVYDCLAYHASWDKRKSNYRLAWPGLGTIARSCGMKRGNVQHAIRRLIKYGAIEKVDANRVSTTYRLLL